MNPIIENLHKYIDDNWAEKSFIDSLKVCLLVLKGLYKSNPEEARFISQFLFRCYYWLEDDEDVKLRNQIKDFHTEILNANQIDYEETDKGLILETLTIYPAYEGHEFLHPWNRTKWGDFYGEDRIEKYKSRFLN